MTSRMSNISTDDFIQKLRISFTFYRTRSILIKQEYIFVYMQYIFVYRINNTIHYISSNICNIQHHKLLHPIAKQKYICIKSILKMIKNITCLYIYISLSNVAKITWSSWRKVAAQKIWLVPEAVVRVLCTPDDGCGWHPKHVEWTGRMIDCIVLHLVGQLLI
jgi:hypothetical protein